MFSGLLNEGIAAPNVHEELWYIDNETEIPVAFGDARHLSVTFRAFQSQWHSEFLSAGEVSSLTSPGWLLAAESSCDSVPPVWCWQEGARERASRFNWLVWPNVKTDGESSLSGLALTSPPPALGLPSPIHAMGSLYGYMTQTQLYQHARELMNTQDVKQAPRTVIGFT